MWLIILIKADFNATKQGFGNGTDIGLAALAAGLMLLLE